MAQTTNQFKLPGFGLPLDHLPDEFLFPNALSSIEYEDSPSAQKALTIRELNMLVFMNNITDKADWWTKVNDGAISNKWKEEARQSKDFDITPAMADYCIAELQHLASAHIAAAAVATTLPPIVVLPGDVVKSDTAVSPDLKLALQTAVKVFESAIPSHRKDWHPESNDMVWDLVHPSLFPLVYGRSAITSGKKTTLDDCIARSGEGTVTRKPKSGGASYSRKFQWLPCDVDISEGKAKITSYINNLHPKNETALYGLVEKVIDASIPLWNRTLAPLADEDYDRKNRIVYTKVEYEVDPECAPESEGPQRLPGEGEWDENYWYRRSQWINETRRYLLPDVKESFSPHAEPAAFDLYEEFAATGLQIIVKLANIQLTPEKPRYEGGSWHVEGQLNEHIVATSLFYYDSVNITPSRLSFRQQVDTDVVDRLNYRQGDHDFMQVIFGLGDVAVQDLGSVETREGRLLTFPNILQHRVGEFELEDATKPGHRKILALFLVDPHMEIISTGHVPCQQQEWWWEAAMAGKNALQPGTGPAIDRVPIELQDTILKGVEFPMSLSDAKALRLELMAERKNFVVQSDKAFKHHAEFNLCEH